MSFIQLTDNYGNKVEINAHHIVYIFQQSKYCSITLSNGEEILVRETQKEIIKKIIWLLSLVRYNNSSTLF